MYVKLFNQILDSSIADNRKLRHFFTDLLLCSDADGNVLMTNTAIAYRIRASLEEVEWGLKELQKPDPASNTLDHEGRRIITLDGHGYGWKILNFEHYRDMKSERQRREETAERVRKHREKVKNSPAKHRKNTEDLPSSAITKDRGRRYEKALAEGDQAKADAILQEGL